MCSRSASDRVTGAAGRHPGLRGRGRQVAEGDLKRRARGEDHRTLDDVLQSRGCCPARHSCVRASMAAEGMVSIRRPIRRANCWVKWRTSSGMSSRRSRSGGSTTGKTFRR